MPHIAPPQRQVLEGAPAGGSSVAMIGMTALKTRIRVIWSCSTSIPSRGRRERDKLMGRTIRLTRKIRATAHKPEECHRRGYRRKERRAGYQTPSLRVLVWIWPLRTLLYHPLTKKQHVVCSWWRRTHLQGEGKGRAAIMSHSQPKRWLSRASAGYSTRLG
jgi:hypothetical protein